MKIDYSLLEFRDQIRVWLSEWAYMTVKDIPPDEGHQLLPLIDAHLSKCCGVKLMFVDWIDIKGKSIYNTEEGIRLSMGDLHSGSTFTLDSLPIEEIKEAANRGFFVTFRVLPRGRDNVRLGN